MKRTLLFIFFLQWVFSLEATTYYVSNSGSNTNSGLSWADAFFTLQHAADLVVEGDTVWVEDGNYAGFDLRTPGTSSDPIVFIAAGSDVTIDQNNPVTSDGINVENADWIVIDGFKVVEQPRNGIRLVLADHCIVRNCYCDNNFERGIFTGFTDNLIVENNICLNSIDEHGIYVSNSSDSVHIRYNTCAFNNAGGIQINADLSAGGDGISEACEIYGNIIYENGVGGGAGINLDGVVGARIYNNLLYENHATGIALFQIDGAEPTSGASLIHNTILQAADGRWCVLIVDGSVDASVYNNILINQHAWRGSIALDQASESGFDSDYNVLVNSLSNMGDGTSVPLSTWQGYGYDLNSELADPLNTLFVDHLNGFFHLLEDAQPVDLGNGSLADGVDKDLDLVLRPQGAEHDIGAYEYETVLAIDEKTEPDEDTNAQRIYRVIPHGHQWSVFSGQDDVNFLVYDVSGKNLFTRQLEKGLNIIQFPGLQAGIYFYAFIKYSMLIHQGKVIPGS